MVAENLHHLLDIDNALDAETDVTVSSTYVSAPAETVMQTSAPGAETETKIQISAADVPEMVTTTSQTDNVMGPGLLLLNNNKISAEQNYYH